MEIFWLLLFGLVPLSEGWSDNRQRKFKDDFFFGAATSAYQIEGGWDADGKGECIWDKYLHQNPEITSDGTNGDVASDSYRKYERDVEMLRELGVHFYRFSISWARVLPNGVTNKKNEAGFQYYDNLIDELLKYDIEPMITLYHFDLPQKLQYLGGWVNPLSVQWFEEYARVIFKRYASKVKYWITINQPSFCLHSYGEGSMAPGIRAKGIGHYTCVKNVMLAHAKAYRLYEREFKKKYGGAVGISISVNWLDPVDNSTENEDAAEELRQFYFGLYLNPIWSEDGDFPTLVKEIVAVKSEEEGHNQSKLPKLSREEIKLLKGSADFLGLNHYTTFLVNRSDKQDEMLCKFIDTDVEVSFGKEWKHSKSPWLKSAPYGLYKACLYINKNYNYPPIFITENGYSTDAGLKDYNRVEHMANYFDALLYAIEDGTDVRGYTYWSLMDNFEWIAGVSERFGLYEVDFESEDKIRTARLSARFYNDVIKRRIVDEKWKSKEIEIKKKKKKSTNKEEL